MHIWLRPTTLQFGCCCYCCLLICLCICQYMWSENVPCFKFCSCCSSSVYMYYAAKVCPVPTAGHYIIQHGVNYSYNATVSYTCPTGFNLLGNASQRCLDTAEWSSQMPVCTQKMCTVPSLPAHMHIVTLNTTFNGTAMLACDSGYHTTNSGSTLLLLLHCTENTTWTGLGTGISCLGKT